jgi:hypothetical protein
LRCSSQTWRGPVSGRRLEAAAVGKFGSIPHSSLKRSSSSWSSSVGQELRDVEADAAGADDRHAFAGNAIALDQVGVGDHLLVFDARQSGRRGTMPVARTTCSKPARPVPAACTSCPVRSVTPAVVQAAIESSAVFR